MFAFHSKKNESRGLPHRAWSPVAPDMHHLQAAVVGQTHASGKCDSGRGTVQEGWRLPVRAQQREPSLRVVLWLSVTRDSA